MILIDRKAEMGCDGEGPTRKRIKAAVENDMDISIGLIPEVSRQEPSAEITIEPFLVDDDDDDEDQAEIPTDTVAALNLLKSEFPKLTGVG